MQANKSVSAGVASVNLSGPLTFDDREGMRELLTMTQDAEVNSVSYDLGGLTAIDSAGIGMLLMANDRFSRAGKSFSIRGATGDVKSSLDLAKVNDLIPSG